MAPDDKFLHLYLNKSIVAEQKLVSLKQPANLVSPPTAPSQQLNKKTFAEDASTLKTTDSVPKAKKGRLGSLSVKEKTTKPSDTSHHDILSSTYLALYVADYFKS